MAIAGLVAHANAQQWSAAPSVGLKETITNNVDLAPSGSRQSDIVTEITPAVSFQERGDRTRLDGFISVPILLYARTGADNNNVYPSANILGDISFLDKIFHVEGEINVSQQFYSPFGGQPISLDNALANRYQTQSYRISPYLRDTTSGGTYYELRNNNVWTNLSGTPIETSGSRYTEVLARAGNTDRMLGWRANYDYLDVSFNDGTSIKTQLGRVGPVYKASPQVLLQANVGYEANDYAFTQSRDTIYGAGFEWSPSERTKVVGNYEQRFFGGSYLFSFKNRTPLSVTSIQAQRNITTYPQQLATVPVGVDVSGFLNSLLLSSIPDPADRQRAVNELIASRGLPGTLTSPVNVYSQQILLQESQTASVALVGARNTILFTVFNIRSEQITAEGTPVPPVLGINSNNTQTGGSVTWTNMLTGKALLQTSLNAYRTIANYPYEGTTRQGIAQVTLSTPLAARTTALVGARYQILQSDVVPDYNEAAVFFGLVYTFR